MQTGFVDFNDRPGTTTGATPSAIAVTGVALGWRFRPGEATVAEIAYGLDQIAYLASAAADRSLQQHVVSGGLERSLRDDLRVGASIGGQLAFTGLSAFRGMQAGGGANAWVALDETDSTTTRLDLEWMHKAGLSTGFGYLTGDRAEAAVSQALRVGPATLVLGDRLRAELIGTSQQQGVIDPFGYAGNTVWLGARAEPVTRLELELSGGIEWRNYLDDHVLLDGSGNEIDRRRRHDRRWFAGASARMRLSQALSLSLRYDLVVNRSNISGGAPARPGPGPGTGCGPIGLGCDDRSYDKHVLTLETGFSW